MTPGRHDAIGGRTVLAKKDTKGGRTAKTEPTQKTHETVTSHKMSEDKSTKGQDAGMAKPTHVALRYPPRRATLPMTRSLDDRVQTLAITPPHSSSGHTPVRRVDATHTKAVHLTNQEARAGHASKLRREADNKIRVSCE